MKKTLMMALGLILCFALGLKAQVTTEPSPLQADSKDVVIYFHADQGSKGLAGQPASAELYAHTGVLLASSSSDADWKYAPTWGDNQTKYKLEYVSDNLWKLNIGNIRTYYGVGASEIIKGLAFVFRNANGSKTGKATGDKDIIVPVLDSGLQISMECSIEGEVVTPETANATFSIGTTEPADIKLSINGKTIATASMSTSLTAEYLFENTGNGSFYVRATATNAEGKTVAAARNFTYAEGSPMVEYPADKIKMGPVRNADGSVTFCLAAPGKTGVYLLGSWNNYEASQASLMNYCDRDGFRYFWQTVADLKDGEQYMYYFLVDAKYKVADPYARLVLDPQNDKYISSEVYPNLPAYPSEVSGTCVGIYQSDINDYDWKVKNFKRPNKSDLVIYELLLRDFTGTEGQKKGDGTVRKALEKIPYLKSLGVNVVELLPINEFNGNISWGYNPNFYFAPDKAYGTPDDYKELIDELHANGIAVVLDVVFNQADWQHPWYVMYTAGTNPFFNASAPHAYSVLNDWNQGYPLVRQQWKDMVQYWLTEYNLDGFRFDLVKGLGDNDSYANSGDSGTNAYNSSRVANMREIQLAMEEVSPGAYFINENLAGTKEENEMAAYGMLNWANINYNGGEYAKGNKAGAGLSRFYAPMDGGRSLGSTVSYLESHDEQRLAYMQDLNGQTGVRGDVAVSMRRLSSAAAQMIMAPGSHMIWMFSEMGNYDSTKNANGGNNTDPKPVRWDLLDQPDRKGLVDSYSELINIRLANTDMFTAPTKVAVYCGDNRWDDGRYIGCKATGKEIYTVVNPTINQTVTVAIPFDSDNNEDYYIVSKSYDTAPSFDAALKTVTVPAGGYAVVATTNVASGVKGLVSEDSNFTVAGQKGSLMVVGASAPVRVFNMNGRQVAVSNAETSTIELPAGIYAVVCGNKSRKVVVR